MTNLGIFFITLYLKRTLNFLLGHGSRPASTLSELLRHVNTKMLSSALLTSTHQNCRKFATFLHSRGKKPKHTVLFIKLKGTHGPLTTPSEFILYPNPSSSNFYFLPFTINFLSSQFMFASSCCLNRLEKYFLNEIIQKVVKLKKYLCYNFKFACPKPNGAWDFGERISSGHNHRNCNP